MRSWKKAACTLHSSTTFKVAETEEIRDEGKNYFLKSKNHQPND